jgi:hypothetical protein
MVSYSLLNERYFQLIWSLTTSVSYLNNRLYLSEINVPEIRTKANALAMGIQWLIVRDARVFLPKRMNKVIKRW